MTGRGRINYDPRMQDTLKVVKLVPTAHPPERANDGDLGYDLFAAEKVVIDAGAAVLVKTGIAMQFPDGWGGVIKDRSSMAVRRITVSAGVIDNGYRGEVAVVLNNNSQHTFVIEPGHKIAQLVPVPVTSWRVVVADTLSDTQRGSGGFGSTGMKKE